MLFAITHLAKKEENCPEILPKSCSGDIVFPYLTCKALAHSRQLLWAMQKWIILLCNANKLKRITSNNIECVHKNFDEDWRYCTRIGVQFYGHIIICKTMPALELRIRQRWLQHDVLFDRDLAFIPRIFALSNSWRIKTNFFPFLLPSIHHLCSFPLRLHQHLFHLRHPTPHPSSRPYPDTPSPSTFTTQPHAIPCHNP